MLFNTLSFLGVYVPVVLAVFLLLGRLRRPDAAILWLGAASLVFYGWDDPWRLLPLILGSILFNFWVGRRLARRHEKWLLVIGVISNLMLLAVFKYAGLLAGTLASILALPPPQWSIVLPIGISFFTFTQIAFLVDAARGAAKEYKPQNYLLFVTYFPHLVAGPILHHQEIMPQFERRETFVWNFARAACGICWFAVGLFKKTVLADGISSYVAPVYDAAAHGGTIGFADAWVATAAYALQLYFDFSGYSDMAIGLSLLFGVMLPLNFASPYRATSLIDFWRRWHITLSRFLRDYLYIPLGGNRRGRWRRYANLLVTMLLGGFWHGASWNFLLWGGIHGLFLALNNVWRDSRPRWLSVPRPLGWLLTMLVVLAAWVPFRATDFTACIAVWQGMLNWQNLASLNLGLLEANSSLWVAGLTAAVLLLPNTQSLLHGKAVPNSATPAPSWWWAIYAGVLFGLGLSTIFAGSVSEFLYFRF